MVNLRRINPLDHFPPSVVFGGVGCVAAGAMAHYGPGQVFDSILYYTKRNLVSISIALAWNSLIGLEGHTIGETLSQTTYALAFAGIGYTIAAPLIHYGRGQVAASIVEEAKKISLSEDFILPVLIGLNAISLVGALMGIMSVDNIINLLNSPPQLFALGAVNYAIGSALLCYCDLEHLAAANLDLEFNLRVLIGLSAISLVGALMGMSVDNIINLLNSPPQLFALGAVNYAIGSTLSYSLLDLFCYTYGSGQVAAAVMAEIKEAASFMLTGLGVITICAPITLITIALIFHVESLHQLVFCTIGAIIYHSIL